MAYLKVENVRITGISAGVPKHAEGSVSTTDKYGAEDFVQTTGIKEKRYDERLTTSDLGLPAAEKLIADLGWDKKEIGALVFVSQTPDYILPATACILQAKLGLERSCMAMDINLGCSGWVYVVEDTGNFAQYGVQFDVFYGDHASASAHGHQTWEAYIADSNGSQEVEVTTTREVNRLDVTLTNHNLDAVLRNRMTDKEQEQYDAYNKYYGNRDYLFDLNTIPTGGAGFGYDIPAEALSDPQFAKMIREAEKYLGYPYVWGGASPSTSFDCSGFVCWVINNCGNGWNVGRTTADGLRSYCSYVSPSDAKPGDLIFFQGTYDTPGASHVGIYVGNNMMIHCGNPIQYTSIASSYWQQHFMAFGRLH